MYSSIRSPHQRLLRRRGFLRLGRLLLPGGFLVLRILLLAWAFPGLRLRFRLWGFFGFRLAPDYDGRGRVDGRLR